MNHSTPTRTIGTDEKGLGAEKNACHAFRTISISMELFAKDRGHPGAPAKMHLIHKLCFSLALNFFSPHFRRLAAKISKKQGVKWDYEYRTNTSTHSSFRQLSNETNHDFLALTVFELELF